MFAVIPSLKMLLFCAPFFSLRSFSLSCAVQHSQFVFHCRATEGFGRRILWLGSSVVIGKQTWKPRISDIKANFRSIFKWKRDYVVRLLCTWRNNCFQRYAPGFVLRTARTLRCHEAHKGPGPTQVSAQSRLWRYDFLIYGVIQGIPFFFVVWLLNLLIRNFWPRLLGYCLISRVHCIFFSSFLNKSFEKFSDAPHHCIYVAQTIHFKTL